MDDIAQSHGGLGAFLSPEILNQVDGVVEGQVPISPLFLYDLGVLTEALCLSDCYTWDTSVPDDEVKQLREAGKNVRPTIGGPVTNVLLESQSIKAYFDRSIQAIAFGANIKFDFDQYFLDYFWLNIPFNYFPLDGDLHSYLNTHAELVRRFKTDAYGRLLHAMRHKATIIVGEIASDETFDLIADIIESHEKMAKAHSDLAEAFGLDSVHLPLLGRWLEARENSDRSYTCIDRILEAAEAKIYSIEDSFRARRGYTEIAVPHFTRILLAGCRSREEIPQRLVEMRRRYAPLRKTVSEYNERVLNAPSIADLQRIDSELSLAWTNVLRKDEQQLTSRLTYRIWDIVKTGPKMVIEFLDLLKRRDELEYPIFRVRGIYDLWSDLKRMPPNWQTGALVEGVFHESIPQEHHAALNNYCDSVEPLLSYRETD
jgi:hypothetical protein